MIDVPQSPVRYPFIPILPEFLRTMTVFKRDSHPRSVFQKSFPESALPTLLRIDRKFGINSPYHAPGVQTGGRISWKAFFKHALGEPDGTFRELYYM